MHKNLSAILISLSLMFLTACSAIGAANTDQPAVGAVPGSGNGNPAANGTPPARGELSQAMQLALGTFKLDQTDYPIDAAQAQKLLPLWKAARSLSSSDTAATQELAAVVRQVEQTMTPEQMQAIQEMKLSFQDMAALGQELGIEMGRSGGFGNMSPEMQATAQAARQSGRPPEGFGGGFPGPGGGPGGLSPEARQTAIARGGGRRANLGLNPALLDAIIKFLEARTK